MPASQAMTGLKGAISNIMKPSSEAAEVAEALGIEWGVGAIKAEGFTGFIDNLKEALNGQRGASEENLAAMSQQIAALEAIQKPTAEQKAQLKALKDEYEIMNAVSGDSVEVLAKLFGSIEGANAMIALSGNQNAAYTKTLASMTEAQRNLNEMSAAYQEGNHELAYEKMKATLAVLSVEVGTVLLPALTSLGEMLVYLLTPVIEFMREHETLATIITTVVAALGVLSLTYGGMLLLLKPVIAFVTALSAVFGTGGVATTAVTAGTAITGVGTAATAAAPGMTLLAGAAAAFTLINIAAFAAIALGIGAIAVSARANVRA
jgi:hypothetical protein